MAVDHGELRLEGVPALPVFRAFVGLLGLCIDGCWDVRRIGAGAPASGGKLLLTARLYAVLMAISSVPIIWQLGWASNTDRNESSLIRARSRSCNKA